MKYTPKPWRYDISRAVYHNGAKVAETRAANGISMEQAHGNAKIIALAPDMFDAILRLARARHESSGAMTHESYSPDITRLFKLVEELAEE